MQPRLPLVIAYYFMLKPCSMEISMVATIIIFFLSKSFHQWFLITFYSSIKKSDNYGCHCYHKLSFLGKPT